MRGTRNHVLFNICIISLLIGMLVSLTGCGVVTAREITEAEINSKGVLILHYSDGSEENLGVVVGKDGADGKDGINGEDGKDGLDGTDGVDGTDGIDGRDGKDGRDGTDGRDGIDGSNTSIVNSVAAATVKGLRSAVKIISQFTQVSSSGGFWYQDESQTSDFSSAGSGVIYQIDKNAGNAFIITNYHVVYDKRTNTKNGISDRIYAFLYGSEMQGQEIPVTYIGGSAYYDIAVLRIENSELLRNSIARAVEIADSDYIAVGDTAIAVGNPENEGISASSGIVSVDSEYLTMSSADGASDISHRVIRVDTAVNSGNSGGGLYNDRGELIGIVNAKIIDESVENIGYAIPSNVAVAITKNIIDYCYGKENETAMRAMLGITVSTKASQGVYDKENDAVYIEEAVEVYEIQENSIAKDMVEVGDVLVSVKIGDKVREITRRHHIIDYLLDARVGDEVELTVLRSGKEVKKIVVITKACLTAY